VIGRVALPLLLLAALACSGGSGGSVTATFVPSGTPAAADLVRLRAVGTSGDTVTLEIAVGGPTTTQDLYAVAFDLALGDPDVVRYREGSAELGPLLGGAAPVLASQNGDRIVVGASRTGGGSGTGVAAGESVLLRLELELRRTGTSEIRFAGSPANPQNPTADPAALDSTGAVIPSIGFDTAPALLEGS
jgi:hypothetical protein